MDSAHWITLHRMRFPASLHAADTPYTAPKGPELWRFIPRVHLGEDGLPTSASDEWVGLGLYTERAAAQAMFDAPHDHLPCLKDASESWHALAAPIAHHGALNWRGRVETDTLFTPNRSLPADGPMLVLTSAGFNADTAITVDRRKEFLRGVQDVLDFYASLPGNLQRGAYSASAVEGMEGFTVSLWDKDREMLAAAYKNGAHKANMDSHEATPMFDRSSWTRARVLASHGTWDGDPLLQAA